jgi:hypothetical protein
MSEDLVDTGGVPGGMSGPPTKSWGPARNEYEAFHDWAVAEIWKLHARVEGLIAELGSVGEGVGRGRRPVEGAMPPGSEPVAPSEWPDLAAIAGTPAGLGSVPVEGVCPRVGDPPPSSP